MKPQTRYTKTSDGVNIAYSVMGSGVPFVFSFPISHQVLLLQSLVWRPWFEGLAARYQLVIYDARGNGLSQRDLPTSSETLALDLDAVVDHLSWRTSSSSPPSVTGTARFTTPSRIQTASPASSSGPAS